MVSSFCVSSVILAPFFLLTVFSLYASEGKCKAFSCGEGTPWSGRSGLSRYERQVSQKEIAYLASVYKRDTLFPFDSYGGTYEANR